MSKLRHSHGVCSSNRHCLCPASQAITAQHVTLTLRTVLVNHATLLDRAASAAGAASCLAVLSCAQNALHLLIKNLYNFLKAWALVWVFVPCTLHHALQRLKAKGKQLNKAPGSMDAASASVNQCHGWTCNRPVQLANG